MVYSIINKNTHENDTNVRVNAIKKILSSPLVASALLSTLLDQLDGSVNSKAPKNEAAKTTSKRQNNILKIAFVARAFNALAPKINVIAKPNATYITTIEAP